MLKRDWTIIEKQAANASDKDVETYEKLVKYLETPVKYDLDRDIYMTRGLMFWLKCNAHRTDVSGKDSPLTLAAKMFSGKIAYAEAFTMLCQKADILCETVEGVSKTGDYKPGDLQIDKDKMKAYWNKVYLLGKWWPIHPRWVLRSVTSSETSSGYTPMRNVSAKGKNQTSSAGKTEITFNDFWFLTPPEIFINKCYPDRALDQLLPSSGLIIRPRRFMKLPYTTPLFYAYGLTLTSEESCIVDTLEGQAKISFKVDREKSKLLLCEYSLSIENSDLQGQENLDELATKYDSGKLVFCSRKKEHFVFEVRCPVVANYQLTISGGLPGEKRKVLLKTKIVCREAMPILRMLPLDAGTLGWGFNPVAKVAGLSQPTIKEPKIIVVPKSSGKRTKTEVRFKMDISVNKAYKAVLHVDGKESESFKDCVKTIQDTTKKELRIEVTVPEVGEYALVIEAADGKTNHFEPVCNYLLTTLETTEEVVEEYFDSSDGTSDIDDEIEELQKKLSDMTEELNKVKSGIKVHV